MIIKRIAALCKAEKNIILLDCDDGTQWVGDGRGFYQLVGMPELGWKYGYPAVIIVSVLVVLISLWIMKKKKFW